MGPTEKRSKQPSPGVTFALKGTSHRALLHFQRLETPLDASGRAKFFQGLERALKAFDLGPLQSEARLHESKARLLLQSMVLLFRRFGHDTRVGAPERHAIAAVGVVPRLFLAQSTKPKNLSGGGEPILAQRHWIMTKAAEARPPAANKRTGAFDILKSSNQLSQRDLRLHARQ